jgi:hypothetical protein
LELQGICTVSADSNSDIAKLGYFFHEAGVQVVCVADRVKDLNVVNDLCLAPFSALFLRYRGLEELLAAELHTDLMRATLTDAPHSRVSLLKKDVVDSASEEAVKQMFYEFLVGNKGSAQFHEWILSQLDEAHLPQTLKEITDITPLLVSQQMHTCKMSLL